VFTESDRGILGVVGGIVSLKESAGRLDTFKNVKQLRFSASHFCYWFNVQKFNFVFLFPPPPPPPPIKWNYCNCGMYVPIKFCINSTVTWHNFHLYMVP